MALALGASAAHGQSAPYPHAEEPIGTVREIYDGALSPEMAVRTFRNIDRLFPSAIIPGSSNPLPLPVAPVAMPPIRITDDGREYGLAEFLDLNRVAGLLVAYWRD
jgi:hypothetical protein